MIGILFSMIAVSSCEEDDVCLGSEGTPQMTVVFKSIYTQQNQSDSLYIDLVDTNLENPINIYNGVYSDSLKLPLGVLENSNSIFRIKRRSYGLEDYLTVNYETKSVYVSKACGFKLTYDQVNYTSTTNDIINIQPVTTTIENETVANLYVFYPN